MPPSIALETSRDFARLLAVALLLDENLGGSGRRPCDYASRILVRIGYWSRERERTAVGSAEYLHAFAAHCDGSGTAACDQWFLGRDSDCVLTRKHFLALTREGRRRAERDLADGYWLLPRLPTLEFAAGVAAGLEG